MTEQERKVGLWVLFIIFIGTIVYSCVSLGPRDTMVAVVTAASIVGGAVWLVEKKKPARRPPEEAVRLRRAILVKEDGVEVILDELNSSAVVVGLDSSGGAKVIITTYPKEIKVKGKDLSCSICERVEEELTITEKGLVCSKCKSS